MHVEGRGSAGGLLGNALLLLGCLGEAVLAHRPLPERGQGLARHVALFFLLCAALVQRLQDVGAELSLLASLPLLLRSGLLIGQSQALGARAARAHGGQAFVEALEGALEVLVFAPPRQAQCGRSEAVDQLQVLATHRLLAYYLAELLPLLGNVGTHGIELLRKLHGEAVVVDRLGLAQAGAEVLQDKEGYFVNGHLAQRRVLGGGEDAPDGGHEAVL
mmetsp:Transcript_5397/g.20533  ORF Transcript_5397/g.20533 Transcript_5397/m.20533 type:complete len:218 (+) Transcript_5397:2690-3343(+)